MLALLQFCPDMTLIVCSFVFCCKYNVACTLGLCYGCVYWGLFWKAGVVCLEAKGEHMAGTIL